MTTKKLSHDILNALERLRIMHDLIRDKNYEHIPKDELMKDLEENLATLKDDFEKLSSGQ